MHHLNAATVAHQLIADTPGTDALTPQDREQLHQTIEGIITRARGVQRVLPEQRPWAKSHHAQMERNARRGDRTAGEDEETAP